MDGTAHFHLALNVDDFPFPQAHAGSYAAGFAKAIVLPQTVNGQPVNLPYLAAGGVNENGFAQDGFLHLLADAPGTVKLRFEGFFHVTQRDHVMVLLFGPKVGFAQQIGDALHVGGQPFRIANQPGTMLNDAGNGRFVEMEQFFFVGQSAN